MSDRHLQHHENALIALLSALPPGRVDSSYEALQTARADESGFRSPTEPLCVVYAQNTDEVALVLSIADEYRVSVVTRGAGTGLAGGAMAGFGEIVLSLERMNRIVRIDIDNQVAHVEAGVLNGAFNAELRKFGFWFAPDPASREISTVGGNIATNAGGLMCAKYGVTREAVLALTVVLANGDVITPGRTTSKGVSGLDVTGLFVGSEGILGVITEAWVRILPLPHGPTETLCAYFTDIEAAARCASEIGAAHLRPLLMELMDFDSLSAVHDYLGLPIVPGGASLLLAQFQDANAVPDSALAERLMTENGAFDVSRASGDRAEELLAIRRAVHPALAALGTTLIEDVCVPRSHLATMFAHIARISAKYELRIPTVSHAGDGNLHPNFIFEGTDVPDKVWDAAHEIFTAALEVGGTLTGEHGVGLLKRRWLKDELGARQYDLQRNIKQVFDPQNILNPGKVFMD